MLIPLYPACSVHLHRVRLLQATNGKLLGGVETLNRTSQADDMAAVRVSFFARTQAWSIRFCPEIPLPVLVLRVIACYDCVAKSFIGLTALERAKQWRTSYWLPAPQAAWAGGRAYSHRTAVEARQSGAC